MLWALDDTRPDGLLVIEHPYFEQRRADACGTNPGTYVATDVEFTNYVSHEWNHGLGEIVTALLDHGMRADDVRRARQRAVGRPARPDGGDRRRRVPAASTVPSACRTRYTLAAVKR